VLILDLALRSLALRPPPVPVTGPTAVPVRIMLAVRSEVANVFAVVAVLAVEADAALEDLERASLGARCARRGDVSIGAGEGKGRIVLSIEGRQEEEGL
jgi:hypothetical protein